MNEAPALHLSGSATIDDVPIFSNITLQARAGEWTCLLGASGVGKSTILKLFAGLSQAITFSGEISEVGRVALMAQDDLLFPWLTAIENVLLGAKLRGEPQDRAHGYHVLERVGLIDHANKHPVALSGGERQRVALARTLMEDRAVILLDEPFSALDVLTRTQMQDLTAEVLKGRTVLLVTHDPAEAARLGHRIFIMEHNRLLNVPVPESQAPRPVDDPNVLNAQAAMLKRLKGLPQANIRTKRGL